MGYLESPIHHQASKGKYQRFARTTERWNGPVTEENEVNIPIQPIGKPMSKLKQSNHITKATIYIHWGTSRRG